MGSFFDCIAYVSIVDAGVAILRPYSIILCLLQPFCNPAVRSHG